MLPINKDNPDNPGDSEKDSIMGGAPSADRQLADLSCTSVLGRQEIRERHRFLFLLRTFLSQNQNSTKFQVDHTGAQKRMTMTWTFLSYISDHIGRKSSSLTYLKHLLKA